MILYEIIFNDGLNYEFTKKIWFTKNDNLPNLFPEFLLQFSSEK